MLSREEFREYARKKARELNLREKDTVPVAEAFYQNYNELSDEIQSLKEMDDILNVIVRELALRARTIPAANKEPWAILKSILSEPHIWKRKLLS